jgi:hypothetical protein
VVELFCQRWGSFQLAEKPTAFYSYSLTELEAVGVKSLKSEAICFS